MSQENNRKKSPKLRRQRNPPTPTTGPTEQTSRPSHRDQGTKTVETDWVMFMPFTFFGFGGCVGQMN